VTLIVTGLLLILSRRKDRSWKAAAGFCVVSGSLLAIWLALNYLCTSTLTGSREPSHTSLIHSTVVAAQILSRWFLPHFVPSLLIVALLAALSFTGRRWIRPAAVFAGVYLVGIVVSCSLTLLDEIDDRLLCPLYVPIVLILLGQSRLFLRLATPLLLLIIPVISTIDDVHAANACGAGGYATDAWVRSGLIGYLRSHPIRGEVYTNEPAATYLFLGRTFQELPVDPPGEGEMYDRMRADALARPTYLVWYKSGYDNVADLDDVLDLFDAAVVTSKPDGAVYRLRVDADG